MWIHEHMLVRLHMHMFRSRYDCEIQPELLRHNIKQTTTEKPSFHFTTPGQNSKNPRKIHTADNPA